MADHAALLREASAAVRPMIEDDLDKRDVYAAWRRKFSDAGLDWMAFKSLQKAHVEDERDESGDGKRVAKIMDRLDCTAAYAEMLGYGFAKMNENNCFSPARSYAEEKGRGVDREARRKQRTSEAMDDTKALSAQAAALGLIDPDAHAETVRLADAVARKYGAGVIDPETGEITDNQESAPTATVREAPAVASAGDGGWSCSAVSPASDESEQDDVGATASSTNSAHKPAGELAADKGDKGRGSFPAGGPAHSNPQVSVPRPAASTGEAMSSSQAQASPATVSDLPISTTPSFAGRVTGDMPDIPAFLDRRQPKAREWEDA